MLAFAYGWLHLDNLLDFLLIIYKHTETLISEVIHLNRLSLILAISAASAFRGRVRDIGREVLIPCFPLSKLFNLHAKRVALFHWRLASVSEIRNTRLAFHEILLCFKSQVWHIAA